MKSRRTIKIDKNSLAKATCKTYLSEHPQFVQVWLAQECIVELVGIGSDGTNMLVQFGDQAGATVYNFAPQQDDFEIDIQFGWYDGGTIAFAAETRDPVVTDEPGGIRRIDISVVDPDDPTKTHAVLTIQITLNAVQL